MRSYSEQARSEATVAFYSHKSVAIAEYPVFVAVIHPSGFSNCKNYETIGVYMTIADVKQKAIRKRSLVNRWWVACLLWCSDCSFSVIKIILPITNLLSVSILAITDIQRFLLWSLIENPVLNSSDSKHIPFPEWRRFFFHQHSKWINIFFDSKCNK